MPKILDLPRSQIFQKDGVLPHWAIDVQRNWDTKLPQRWNARGGPMAGPGRTPDLPPLDFLCDAT